MMLGQSRARCCRASPKVMAEGAQSRREGAWLRNTVGRSAGLRHLQLTGSAN